MGRKKKKKKRVIFMKRVALFLVISLFLGALAVEIVDETDSDQDCVECADTRLQSGAAESAPKKTRPLAPARARQHPVHPFWGNWRFWPSPWDEIDFFPFEERKTRQEAAISFPKLDIHDSKSEIVVHASVPGVKSDDVKIVVERPGILSIKGHRSTRSSKTHGRWTTSESYEGSFVRRLRIDRSLRAADISAKLEHGELEITIPKQTTHEKSNEVKINIS